MILCPRFSQWGLGNASMRKCYMMQFSNLWSRPYIWIKFVYKLIILFNVEINIIVLYVILTQF